MWSNHHREGLRHCPLPNVQRHLQPLEYVQQALWHGAAAAPFILQEFAGGHCRKRQMQCPNHRSGHQVLQREVLQCRACVVCITVEHVFASLYWS